MAMRVRNAPLHLPVRPSRRILGLGSDERKRRAAALPDLHRAGAPCPGAPGRRQSVGWRVDGLRRRRPCLRWAELRRPLLRCGLRPLTRALPAHTGRCRCGTVRFEADGRPNWTSYCHCESCRRATGAPVAAYAGFPVQAVRFPAGPPAEYGSAPGVRRGFCGRCGSPLSFTGDRWPGEIHLHLGSFDDCAALVRTARRSRGCPGCTCRCRARDARRAPAKTPRPWPAPA
jgi:hypothetical protein